MSDESTIPVEPILGAILLFCLGLAAVDVLEPARFSTLSIDGFVHVLFFPVLVHINMFWYAGNLLYKVLPAMVLAGGAAMMSFLCNRTTFALVDGQLAFQSHQTTCYYA